MTLLSFDFVVASSSEAFSANPQPESWYLRCNDSMDVLASKTFHNLRSLSKFNLDETASRFDLDGCSISENGAWFKLSGTPPGYDELVNIAREKSWVCNRRYSIDIQCQHGCDDCNKKVFVTGVLRHPVIVIGKFIASVLSISPDDAKKKERESRMRRHEFVTLLRRMWPIAVTDLAMLSTSVPRTDRDGAIRLAVMIPQMVLYLLVWSLRLGGSDIAIFVIVALSVNLYSSGLSKGIRPAVMSSIVVSFFLQVFIVLGYAYGEGVYNLLFALVLFVSGALAFVTSLTTGSQDLQYLLNLVFSSVTVYQLASRLSSIHENHFITSFVRYLMTCVVPDGEYGFSALYSMMRGAVDITHLVDGLVREFLGPVFATAGTFLAVLFAGGVVFVAVRVVFGAAFVVRSRNENIFQHLLRCLTMGVSGYELCVSPVVSMAGGGREKNVGLSIMFAAFKFVELTTAPDVAMISLGICMVRLLYTTLSPRGLRFVYSLDDLKLLAEFNVRGGSDWTSFDELLRASKCCYTVLSKRGDQVVRGCGAIITHAGGPVLVTAQHVVGGVRSVLVYPWNSDGSVKHEVAFDTPREYSTVDDPCLVIPVQGFRPDEEGFPLAAANDLSRIKSMWAVQATNGQLQNVSSWNYAAGMLEVDAGFNRGDSGSPVFVTLDDKSIKLIGVVSAGTTSMSTPNVVSPVPTLSGRVRFSRGLGSGIERDEPLSSHDIPVTQSTTELNLAVTLISQIVGKLASKPSGEDRPKMLKWENDLRSLSNDLAVVSRMSRASSTAFKRQVLTLPAVPLGSVAAMVVSEDERFMQTVREMISAKGEDSS